MMALRLLIILAYQGLMFGSCGLPEQAKALPVSPEYEYVVQDAIALLYFFFAYAGRKRLLEITGRASLLTKPFNTGVVDAVIADNAGR